MFIRLADSQRSLLYLLFAKQSGSPVRMRTYDPFVYSLGVKCFVFSSRISLQAALRTCESSAQKPKLILLRSESAVCSFAYFCCYNGKCGASCCSCRHSCAGFGHGFTGGFFFAGQCWRNAVGIRWPLGSPPSA